MNPVEIELNGVASGRDVLHFVDAILVGEHNVVANLANVSSVLNLYLPVINWVGFYVTEARTRDLVLGPYAGKPACTRIPLGRGVVGTAAERQQTLLVGNVMEFPGHIACDAESRSEIVVPVCVDGHTVAVIDVDSPEFNRFGPSEQELLQDIALRLSVAWSEMTWY